MRLHRNTSADKQSFLKKRLLVGGCINNFRFKTDRGVFKDSLKMEKYFAYAQAVIIT